VIPELDDGVLPDGVHDCTLDEVEAAFGRFRRSDRRIQLTARLKAYFADAVRSGVVAAVYIDGSYVTAKDEPDDIDLIVAVKAGVDTTSLRPFEYNAISKRVIRGTYKFDALVAGEGTDKLDEYIGFFAQVNPVKAQAYTSRTSKGFLRIVL
jgi:hypothetical protein